MYIAKKEILTLGYEIKQLGQVDLCETRRNFGDYFSENSSFFHFMGQQHQKNERRSGFHLKAGK